MPLRIVAVAAGFYALDLVLQQPLFLALVLTGWQLLTPGVTDGALVAFTLGRVCAVAAHVGFAHLSVQAYRGSTWSCRS